MGEKITGTTETLIGPATDRLLAKDRVLWTPTYTYGRYDHREMSTRVAHLQELLETSDYKPVNDDIDYRETNDVDRTQEFIDRIFQEFGSPNLSETGQGSFGFVVPSRTRRNVRGVSDEYMAEWKGLCPLLWHFDSDVTQRFVAGLPPFIVDRYGVDADGRQGYMLFTPIFQDMFSDFGTDTALFYETSAKILNDTFELARRLGINTIGLGATLPKVLLKIDKQDAAQGSESRIKNQGIDLTTGHAGTVWLIGETIAGLEKEGYPGFNSRIGVLGTGAIGAATIAHLRENLGFQKALTVYDLNVSLSRAVASSHQNVGVAQSVKSLIESSDVIICAATDSMKLADHGINDKTALQGKVMIDDSQPGCFTPEDIRAYGGELVWVIGQDPTNSEISRRHFDYGALGPAQRHEIWGCEAETYAVHQHNKNGRGLGSVAVRRIVRVGDVKNIGRILTQKGATAAPLQAGGRYLRKKVADHDH